MESFLDPGPRSCIGEGLSHRRADAPRRDHFAAFDLRTADPRKGQARRWQSYRPGASSRREDEYQLWDHITGARSAQFSNSSQYSRMEMRNRGEESTIPTRNCRILNLGVRGVDVHGGQR